MAEIVVLEVVIGAAGDTALGCNVDVVKGVSCVGTNCYANSVVGVGVIQAVKYA